MLLIMAVFASGPDSPFCCGSLAVEVNDLLPVEVLNLGGTPFGYWALTARFRAECAQVKFNLNYALTLITLITLSILL